MSKDHDATDYRVLAIGAHPDDLEMAMGGTIARLTQAGHRVLMISLTRGENSTHGTPEEREREAQNAARILGADLRLLDYPDTQVENTDEARRRIARLVREHRPSLVFAPYHTNPGTHHDGRANRDHMCVGTIVRDGLKLARFQRLMPELPPHDVRRLLYYMVPANRLPSLVVDVTAQADVLRRAIEAYESQMAIQRSDNSIQDVLEAMRRSTGMMIGRRLGEGFLTDEALEAGVDELLRL